MRVVILGAGDVGAQVAGELVREGVDVVVIERDSERANVLEHTIDCQVIRGAGTKLSVLEEAAVDRAQFFLALTESDETNMIACGLVSARFPEPPLTIARVRNEDLGMTLRSRSQDGDLEDDQPHGRLLGVNHLLHPEMEAVNAIVHSVEQGAVGNVLSFEKTDVQIRSVTVGSDSPFLGQTLSELRTRFDDRFLVAVIARDQDLHIPRGDTRILEKDTLYIAASESNFDVVLNRIGRPRKTAKNIVIVGGGIIGAEVAERLATPHRRRGLGALLRLFRQKDTRRITIIERDPLLQQDLAGRFRNIEVVGGDITDDSLFRAEGVGNADLLIATTGNQELNIVSAIYAARRGVKRTVALVNKPGYERIADSLGIDVVVSRIGSMVGSVLKHIRQANVRSVHSLSGGALEFVELQAEEGGRVINKEIRDLRLPRETLVIAICREGAEGKIAEAADVIREGDEVVVVCRKTDLPRIQALFKKPR